jgi:acyl carrier protein
VDQELLGRLQALLQAVVEEDMNVMPDDNLFKVGVLDSMLLIRLVERMEKEFNISVADREMSPDYFLSLERMSLFVRTKLAKAEGKQVGEG